jgi:hypothetical protein
MLAALVPAAAGDTPLLPELLQQALSAPQANKVYAFDFVDTRTGDRTGVTRGRIDPTRPKGDRVTIFETTGDETDPRKIDERYEKDADGDIWCDQLGNVDGAVTDRGMYASGRAFAFTPKARPDAGGDEKKLYKQLAAEVIVDPATAKMKSFTARLPKPWKPNMLAKISHVEMTGQCAVAPNGRAYQIETTMNLRGSALGSDFTQGFRRTVTLLTTTTPSG